MHIFKYVLTCTARGFVPAIHRILLQTERVFFLLLSNYAVAFLGLVYNQFNAYILVYLRGTIWCQDGETTTNTVASVMGRSAKSALSSSRKSSGPRSGLITLTILSFLKKKTTQHYKLLKFTQCCTRERLVVNIYPCSIILQS